jgi:hypothetical protein
MRMGSCAKNWQSGNAVVRARGIAQRPGAFFIGGGVGWGAAGWDERVGGPVAGGSERHQTRGEGRG